MYQIVQNEKFDKYFEDSTAAALSNYESTKSVCFEMTFNQLFYNHRKRNFIHNLHLIDYIRSPILLLTDWTSIKCLTLNVEVETLHLPRSLSHLDLTFVAGVAEENLKEIAIYGSKLTFLKLRCFMDTCNGGFGINFEHLWKKTDNAEKEREECELKRTGAKEREAKEKEAKEREAKEKEAKEREAKEKEAKEREAKEKEQDKLERSKGPRVKKGRTKGGQEKGEKTKEEKAKGKKAIQKSPAVTPSSAENKAENMAADAESTTAEAETIAAEAEIEVDDDETLATIAAHAKVFHKVAKELAKKESILESLILINMSTVYFDGMQICDLLEVHSSIRNLAISFEKSDEPFDLFSKEVLNQILQLRSLEFLLVEGVKLFPMSSFSTTNQVFKNLQHVIIDDGGSACGDEFECLLENSKQLHYLDIRNTRLNLEKFGLAVKHHPSLQRLTLFVESCETCLIKSELKNKIDMLRILLVFRSPILTNFCYCQYLKDHYINYLRKDLRESFKIDDLGQRSLNPDTCDVPALRIMIKKYLGNFCDSSNSCIPGCNVYRSQKLVCPGNSSDPNSH